jgi:ketosteroid isomerase-like protein
LFYSVEGNFVGDFPMMRIEDRLAIDDLNAEFAYCLDHNEVAPLVALFTDDAIYSHGSRQSVGKDEIAAFFRSRTAAGPRTARHFCSGLRLFFLEDEVARATSLWLTFAHNGSPPIANCDPFLVADFMDVYRRGADGRWRIESRHIEPIFRNPAIPPPGGGGGAR